jgi:hypothetical protein
VADRDDLARIYAEHFGEDLTDLDDLDWQLFDRILAAGWVKATAATEQCPCYDCVSPTWVQWESHMVLCPDCGNKRCPHATFHGNACTGSNDPDQSGSRYTALRALHPNQEA